ncbi:hypothetical protein [Gimesia algae]|uniref:Uncharacterized protein n=1 Tax=Gimesia algae TaxID=2527971 RepID=A0A517VMW6_9PLAN|nr:hypothetical protein [Gimesia algae]QDT94352.1 hypothetical protein Pan161_60480 [Gimesia algae]
MFDSSQDSPGQWFTCLNVGDDMIVDKDSRRKDKDLLIPPRSLVEVVGIRNLNDDHLVHEIRLPVGITAPGQNETPGEDGNVPKYVTNGINYAFTGPASIGKGYQGRMTYTPAFVRYEGDESDNEKIFGRFVRDPNSRLSDATLDGLEKLYGTGIVQQLVGDPAGHLKLPNDLTKASRFQIQHQLLGWNVHGIYKLTTGVKKEDKDSTENLFAFVAPANQLAVPPPIHFITKEPYSNYVVRTYESDSYDYDGDLRSGQKYAVRVDGDNPVPVSVLHKDTGGNDKMWVSFVGDDVNGSIKLAMGDSETSKISLTSSVLTPAYLAEKIGELPGIDAEDLKVSIWPGRWLIEFAGKLAGQVFDEFEVDIPEAAVFDVYVFKTDLADAEMDAEVHYPIPLIGEWDGDDNTVNDAVAPGSLGTAQWFPGEGWVSDVNECRDYNGDGSPEL